MIDGIKLAIDVFPKAISNIEDKDVLKYLKSKCRDFPEEALNSGFLSAFLFYLSKSNICALVNFLKYLNSNSESKFDKFDQNESKQTIAYTIYTALVIYFLEKTELKNKLGLNDLDKLCPNNDVSESAKKLEEILNGLYFNSSIVTVLSKNYLLTLKRLAEATINV
ncbi:type III-B CRISPR module-associated protein Cmr5 [Saccharolobus islandicus]|uniref:CRISPR type III-B/RAMP module-associated protein Cmr5 n=2 Tax=Saccharolobus islandicus TaxID=43080 RepID=C3MX98_SACI4|nr:type III-B CRISPR module-associated protein Cmr5 [Sulfolobus islandicus]ACP37778.1 CRISPR-associated protein, Cmr5 family [Sulfolobus islandicus M.14.25]ACP54972.1 CRISPR-associated protein, Cmr5 family [Sulfolobus islandicus M.16.27]